MHTTLEPGCSRLAPAGTHLVAQFLGGRALGGGAGLGVPPRVACRGTASRGFGAGSGAFVGGGRAVTWFWWRLCPRPKNQTSDEVVKGYDVNTNNHAGNNVRTSDLSWYWHSKQQNSVDTVAYPRGKLCLVLPGVEGGVPCEWCTHLGFWQNGA